MKHTSIAGLLLVLFIAVKICILCLVVSMFVGATTRAGAQSAKVLFDDSGPDSGRHHWIEDMCLPNDSSSVCIRAGFLCSRKPKSIAG